MNFEYKLSVRPERTVTEDGKVYESPRSRFVAEVE